MTENKNCEHFIFSETEDELFRKSVELDKSNEKLFESSQNLKIAAIKLKEKTEILLAAFTGVKKINDRTEMW